MDSDVQAKFDDLEKRVAYQETLHRKHSPDGNVYHWDFRKQDVIKLVGLGLVIGVVSGVVFGLIKKKS
jgi:hypothetical protein